MTTKDGDRRKDASKAQMGDPAAAMADLAALNANLLKVEALSQRLVAALAKREGVRPSLQGPAPDLFTKAAAAYMSELVSNPSKILQHQVNYWSRSMRNYVEVQQALATGGLQAPKDHTPEDKRFSSPLWRTHPYFNYLKQQYLISSEAMSEAISSLEGLDERDRRRVAYFARQIMDLMSPANFLGTNPDALAKAVETDGQSLVDGLENLVRDIEAGGGEILVSLADRDAFRVGENLATTPGSVVYRNRLFELIQYAPTTEQAHRRPLVIFPPWINKFYILDLRENNSLIRWIVDQGYTLFVVSWRDPDPSMRDVALDDYVEQGFLTAIREVKAITGSKDVNAVGYCIAGTTLSLTLALMAKRGMKDVHSATFLTTLTDFSDQGEVGVFLTDDFIDGIEREVDEKGILPAFFMNRTFSYMRSRDLVYEPAVKSYMMGEAPPAFDLLFWNGDSTNLPAAMAKQYLRELCQKDRFAQGGIEILGETLRLSDVSVPVAAVACQTDHIAAWKAAYNGVRAMGSKDKTFLLSESGHIAGIVNPPTKKKYGHYTNGDWSGNADGWLEGADFHEGSWWPRWGEWLAGRSGPMVAARQPGEGGREILAAAPGEYVVASRAA
jgi:polyhydroxyalkanoate synthase